MIQKVDSIFSKEFITFWIINFLISIIFFLLMVTVGEYTVVLYDVSTSQAGLASGIYWVH